MPAHPAPTPTLIERVRAAESTIQAFCGQPLEWGRCDCLRMVAHHLRELGRAPPLRDAGFYRSHLGAHKALKRTTFATLDAWVDSWGLMRLPAAFALTGDVLAYATEEPTMPSLAVQLSNGRVLAFVPELGVAASIHIVAGVDPLACWRA